MKVNSFDTRFQQHMHMEAKPATITRQTEPFVIFPWKIAKLFKSSSVIQKG